MNKKLKILLLLPILLSIPFLGHAQKNTIIPVESWHYEYIKRLQLRGHLLELNPSRLPYTTGELREALENMEGIEGGSREAEWLSLLKESVKDRPDNIDDMRVGGTFVGGLRRSSSERLDVLNPLGEGEIALPRGQLQGYLEWQNWIGQMGVTFDWFYDIDPDGIDTGDRLYMRSEEGYFGYHGDFVEVLVGRFDNHWSVYGRQGAFLTSNPQAFDQLQIKLGSSKLSFRSILGELDNMSPDSTFNGYSHGPGAFRRYYSAHRIDWSPIPTLKLSFIEAETYFSPSAGISLKNLLPLQFLFFESSNAPQNSNVNLGVGGSIWYQLDSFTFYVQAMLDDLVVEDRGELQENNELVPTVYTINSLITIADIGNSIDLGFEADLVSSNSYRSFRYQDQWTYLQRGLATNFSDYIRLKAYSSFYPGGIENLKIEPSLALYWKGVGDMRELRTTTNPDGSQIPGILSGTVERTIRPGLYLRYQPPGSQLFGEEKDVRFNWWFDADMGVNFVEDAGNEEGISDTRFIGLFRLFGRVTF